MKYLFDKIILVIVALFIFFAFFPNLTGLSLNNSPFIFFGLYFKCNGKNISIPDKDVDISIIDIEYSRKIIEAFNNGSTGALKTFNVKDKVINVRNGEFGNYVQIISANNKKENISIPKKYSIENISIDDIMQIISDKRDNPTKEFSKKKYYNKK